MEKNKKCTSLNNGTYCETKKKYVSVSDCENCSDKTEPSLNENLQFLND